jgi:predicted lipoprotein with Yx(FWY)xxD motif
MTSLLLHLRSRRAVAAGARVATALAGLAAATIAIAGCGGTTASGARPAATSSSPVATGAATSGSAASTASAPNSAPTVRLERSAYGRVLFDSHGRSLYLFTHDVSNKARCYGGCAAAWPPYIVKSARVTAGNGTTAGLLGTTRRSDGSVQVTYAGHPLYHYTGDRQPGQILCQNVDEFGGTWLVVSSRGAAVR